MKNPLSIKVIFTCLCLLLSVTLTAQSIIQSNSSTTDVNWSQKKDQYQKLKKLGYSEKEIFEDLGNANFLLEKYGNAIFWYNKLRDLDYDKELNSNYQKRYQFALEQTATANSIVSNSTSWLQQIKDDYQVKREFDSHKAQRDVVSNREEFDFNPIYRSQSLEYLVEFERNKAFIGMPNVKKTAAKETYESPIAVTANGKTAYFSKAISMQPVKGVFSKKELVHKIYRTDKINGRWKNVREITLAPKHTSAMHPAISDDGKRLFFASNMSGSFGNYDIYVSNISDDGAAGQAKNLGTKVNTKKNELYPRLVEGNTLVFASEGREGYGGLDLYTAEVGTKKVSWATNLGSPINSSQDDFSMYVLSEKGVGYVLSNRGNNKNIIQEVAFSYATDKKPEEDERETNFRKSLNNNLKIDYTTSVFEDK